MQLSLDGYNSTGPNDEQKWVTWAWDEIQHDVLALAAGCDTELIGRKLAEDYIPYWNETLNQPDSEMFETARIKAAQKKIVFTKTLDKSIWPNTEIAKGDLAEEVNRLKNQSSKDIIVYGGSAFVASLVKEQLIDEFYLYMNPIALGQGVALFNQLNAWQPLKLIQSKTFDCGIVLLQYARQE
jgi:dihydrofolate reductase